MHQNYIYHTNQLINNIQNVNNFSNFLIFNLTLQKVIKLDRFEKKETKLGF